MEDNLQICFEEIPDDSTPKEGAPAGPSIAESDFRTGDYWVFPARTATADVEWPAETIAETVIAADVSAQFCGTDITSVFFGNPVPIRLNGQAPGPADPRKPAALPPHGIRHRYALLAVAVWRNIGDQQEASWQFDDLRRILRLCEVEAEFRREPIEKQPTDTPAVAAPVATFPGRDVLVGAIAEAPSVKISQIVGNKVVAAERKQLETNRKSLVAGGNIPKPKAKAKKATEDPK